MTKTAKDKRDVTGLAAHESLDVEWYKVPTLNEHDSDFFDVCVLRIQTVDGVRVIKRDKIEGISRIATGAVHRDPNGPTDQVAREIPVMTTVLIMGGQSIALGGTRSGTSDELHSRIEMAWLGNGFDPLEERQG